MSECRRSDALAIVIAQVLLVAAGEEHCAHQDNCDRGLRKSHEVEELVWQAQE
jgi:hypothetical protein